MLAQTCDTKEGRVVELTNEHEKAEMGCFVNMPFGKRMMAGYYSNTQTYVNLSVEKVMGR